MSVSTVPVGIQAAYRQLASRSSGSKAVISPCTTTKPMTTAHSTIAGTDTHQTTTGEITFIQARTHRHLATIQSIRRTDWTSSQRSSPKSKPASVDFGATNDGACILISPHDILLRSVDTGSITSHDCDQFVSYASRCKVVRFAHNQYRSISAALNEFASWKGRSTPFTELAPAGHNSHAQS
jgi:hypothetical protein